MYYDTTIYNNSIDILEIQIDRFETKSFRSDIVYLTYYNEDGEILECTTDMDGLKAIKSLIEDALDRYEKYNKELKNG